MAPKKYEYKTISFRLDINNPLDRQLLDELQKHRTNVRNKIIKDSLIQELLIKNGKKPKENLTSVQIDNQEVLNVIYDKLAALEKRINRELPPKKEQQEVVNATELPQNPLEEIMDEPTVPSVTGPQSVEEQDEDIPVPAEALAFLSSNGFM